MDVAFTEFYLRFVSQYEDLCVVSTPVEISLTSSTVLADVPLDFLKLKGLKIKNEYFLTPVSNVIETERFRYGTGRAKPTHFWLSGTHDVTVTARPAKIMPLPLPDGAYTLEIYYVPNLTLGSVESDSNTWATGALGYGCDEYVVLKAAMKLKDKEESDCSVIMAELKDLWASIERFLTPLDESMPKRVTAHMMRTSLGFDPYGAEEDFG